MSLGLFLEAMKDEVIDSYHYLHFHSGMVQMMNDSLLFSVGRTFSYLSEMGTFVRECPLCEEKLERWTDRAVVVLLLLLLL